MTTIWNNHFICKNKLIYEVLVDAISRERKDFGRIETIFLVDEVIHGYVMKEVSVSGSPHVF
ncbi:unnamed protein product [marine sediment metagenome]|uniref:Uncharacterized protein n=1 Tax=marine sediment metagenome TaxID=412755 RepID=X0VAN2_9ZZZZ